MAIGSNNGNVQEQHGFKSLGFALTSILGLKMPATLLLGG